VLFEIATEGPGFLIDELENALGESLKLPEWFESRRAAIEESLPPVTLRPVEQITKD
jgi:glyoxalase family protein